MTIQTAVLVETLKALGADVRWASCNIFSTQDHPAAAIAASGIPVFAIKGETLVDYWEYTDKTFQFGGEGGLCNMILDDGRDVILYILLGARVEEGEENLIIVPNSEEEKALFSQIRKRMATTLGWFVRQRHAIKGVSEETTTGVHRLYDLHKKAQMPFPVINVNDSVAQLRNQKWTHIKEQADMILLSEGRLLSLGNATGHPSCMMSARFTNQVLAQIELWTKQGEYAPGVYIPPKHLDEKVAHPLLAKIGAKLTTLKRGRADYIGVAADGPFKPEHNRY